MLLRRLSEQSAACKAQARGALTGKYGVAVGANLFVWGASFLLPQVILLLSPGNGLLFLLSSLALTFCAALLLGVLRAGLYFLYLNILFDRPATFGDLFYVFRENADKAIRVQAALSGLEIACLLPSMAAQFLLPGAAPAIVAARVLLYLAGSAVWIFFQLRFSLSFFLLLDFPQLSALAVLRQSARLMRGRKGRLLYMALSFLPLCLLGLLSCGVGFLWLAAYFYETLAAFYKNAVTAVK